MEIAHNVIRLAPLITELVNLVTPRWRGGSELPRLPEGRLADAFTALLDSRSAADIQAVSDVETRLTALAWALRDAITAPSPSVMAARVNDMIERYRARPYLVDDMDQPFHIHFDGDGETPVESMGGEFASAVALIVDGYGVERFGSCEAHQCEAVYIDLTRNGSRRYCSSGCTARAKTAAYRKRRAGET